MFVVVCLMSFAAVFDAAAVGGVTISTSQTRFLLLLSSVELASCCCCIFSCATVLFVRIHSLSVSEGDRETSPDATDDAPPSAETEQSMCVTPGSRWSLDSLFQPR